MKPIGPQPRIDRSSYDRTAPDVTAALSALGKAVDASGLDKTLTLMAANEVSEGVYGELQQQFAEPEIVFLTAAVGTINMWNRIAGALHFAPPAATAAGAA